MQSIVPSTTRKAAGIFFYKMVTIYYLTNKEGVPFYVGQTTRPSRRLWAHRSRFGTHTLMEELAYVDDKDKLKEEAFYIEMFISWGFSLVNKHKSKNRNLITTVYIDDIKPKRKTKACGQKIRKIDPTLSKEEIQDLETDRFNKMIDLIAEVRRLKEDLKIVKSDLNNIKKQKNIPEGFFVIEIQIPEFDYNKYKMEQRAKKKTIKESYQKDAIQTMITPRETPENLIYTAKQSLILNTN